MVFSQITTNPGEVCSISLTTKYVESPLQAFETLTASSQHALLLESAEIDSKDNLKSLMLLDAAVVFQCFGNTVSVEAQNSNGMNIVKFINSQFTSFKQATVTSELSDNVLNLTFYPVDSLQDEDARLKEINAFEALRQVVNNVRSNREDDFALFLGGAFAYDMLANFEHLPPVPNGENTCPDYVFYLAETMVVFDHQLEQTEIIGNVFSGEDAYANCFSVGKRIEAIKTQLDSLTHQHHGFGFKSIECNGVVSTDVDDQSFKEAVIQLKQNIVEGDVFQVVPSRHFALECNKPLDAYRHLKHDNPSPYMFFLKHPEFSLFGASPESALKYNSTTHDVEVYPIAGTRKRGFNPDGSINHDLDGRIELELRNDKKEVAEHLMLVDLARNDVARISETGTRRVAELLKVDRYSYVMHLVSRVVGKLRTDLDALHAYQACMNMGTLVGAPKIKAASLIREFENKRRGSYGGAVGYINGRGDMDTCIVIRSAFVKDSIAYIQAGAGVVFDSDPQSEADETRNKAQAVIRAVQASQALHQKD